MRSVPTDEDTLYSYAQSLEALGRVEDAVAKYRAALAVNEKSVNANDRLAARIPGSLGLKKSGQTTPCPDYLDAALRHWPRKQSAAQQVSCDKVRAFPAGEDACTRTVPFATLPALIAEIQAAGLRETATG